MASRRRTFELPKSPDEGLVQWTSKIKAIQQEVDEDEEAERRRLQEEIERSRTERAKRRSALTVSSDMSKKVGLPPAEPSSPLHSYADPKDHRSDALRKLVATNSTTEQAMAGAARLSSTPTAQKAGMSLAEFMGGKATGPRLNKHAPQSESHNPEVYDQTRREGPHPIFGMAGTVRKVPSKSTMVTSSSTNSSTEEVKSNRPIVESPKPAEAPPKLPDILSVEVSKKPGLPTKAVEGQGSEKEAESLLSRPVEEPAISRPPSQPAEEPATSLPPKPAAIPAQFLQHTTGVSKPSAPSLWLTNSSRPSPPAAAPKPISLAEMVGGRATGPRLSKPMNTDIPQTDSPSIQGRALPGLAVSPRISPPPNPSAAPKPAALRSTSLGTEATDISAVKPISVSPPSRPASASNLRTPSLARPIQPNVAAAPSIIATASPTPSPAFLRPAPSTQDLHPSLTRLQARGIVNQRVKAASQLFEDKDRKEGSASPPTPSKRTSVLDRWQPAVTSSTSSSPSPSSSPAGPKPGLYRELPGLGGSAPRSTKPAYAQSTPSEGEAHKVAAPVRLPGMGNPNALPPKVIIDSPPSTPSKPLHESNVSDEASIKPKGMATAPLSHPTRDRARKPRKGPSASPKDTSALTGVNQASVVRDSPASSTKALELAERPKEVEPPAEKPPVSVFEDSSGGIVEAEDKKLTNGSKYTQLEYRRPSTGPQPSVIVSPRPVTPGSPVRTRSNDDAPSTPRSRIPSTGNRATVMDVAQALLEHEQHIREASFTPEPEPVQESPPQEPVEEEEAPRPDVRSIVAGWGRTTTTSQRPIPEKRRSSYESRFAVSALPPLVEVKTPAETPHASLTRGFSQSEQHPPRAQEVHQALKEWSRQSLEVIEDKPVQEVEADSEDEVEPEALPQFEAPSEQPHEVHIVPEQVAPVTTQEAVGKPEPKELPVIQAGSQISEQATRPAFEENITLNFQESLPPAFNPSAILKETPFNLNSKIQTISVDVLLISGSTTTALTEEPNVFYDTEIVGVIHRCKEKTGELVSNQVWIWKGRNADFGPKEQRKAAELSERYGTTAVHCNHGSEPSQLIHVLGGVMAVRQGYRAHWSQENTAMHRILRVGDSMFVDEVDLGIWNLCSAYSYCLSILGSVYVWHGRGATEDERKVAATYAQSLTSTPSSIVEFDEGNEDEMFWMILGKDDYASADFWRFKDRLERVGPRFFTVDCRNRKAPVQTLPGTPAMELVEGGVFVVDCRLEVFVIVTAGARGRRTDIQIALFLAQNISASLAHKRPFNPPIHVVILPSKLPLELRAAIRLCDEAALNGGTVPDHMNLISAADAFDQLQRRTWPRAYLSDHTFLPLGVDPSMF